MHASDTALVEACLKGDASAWNELVERYGRLVYSIPRRYGLGSMDADDVFQSVFLVLHRELRNIRDTARLSAWLITTTQRECWRAKKRSRRYSDLDPSVADPTDGSDEQVELWERQHLVRQALRELAQPCRSLLTLLFMDAGRPSYDEIAARLSIKVGSIGPTRARCLKKLENLLLELGLRAERE